MPIISPAHTSARLMTSRRPLLICCSPVPVVLAHCTPNANTWCPKTGADYTTLVLCLRLPALPHVIHSTMAMQTATMPCTCGLAMIAWVEHVRGELWLTLMMALRTAAMPLMMAMQHEPIAAKTVSIYRQCQFQSAVEQGAGVNIHRMRLHPFWWWLCRLLVATC